MNKKYLLIGGGALLAVAAVAAIVVSTRGDELEEVQTATVERQKIVQKVNATGRIQPKDQVKISADVSAKITRLGVEEGDWVDEGQFLVELDRERYLAQVESAEANVRSAQAEAARSLTARASWSGAGWSRKRCLTRSRPPTRWKSPGTNPRWTR
jgi:HlyD family secretion protein